MSWQSYLTEEGSEDWVVRAARGPVGVWLEGRLIPQEETTLQQTAKSGNLSPQAPGHLWILEQGTGPCALGCARASRWPRAGMVGALVVIGRANTLREQDIALTEHVAATGRHRCGEGLALYDLEEFAEEVERSQIQLIQAEKWRRWGGLTASLAHEINNPPPGDPEQPSPGLAQGPRGTTETAVPGYGAE